MQGLGGMGGGLGRGASMSGNRATSNTGTDGVKRLVFGQDQSTSPVTGSFTAEDPGQYEFALFGNGDALGGGLCVHEERLQRGEIVAYVVGSPNGGTNTTVTLPDGAVLTAQAGNNGGSASGGNLANLTRSSYQAPSFEAYQGGTANSTPGGGAVNVNDPAGAGMLIITKVLD